MPPEQPDTFPWSKGGRLCVVLNEESVWLKVFDLSPFRHAVKRACRRIGWRKEFRTNDNPAFGEAALWLLNRFEGRIELEKSLNESSSCNVEQLLFRAFYPCVKEVMPTEAFCTHFEDGRFYVDSIKLESWLSLNPLSDELSRSVILVLCAFAILQPDLALAIRGLLFQYLPRSRMLLKAAVAVDESKTTAETQQIVRTADYPRKVKSAIETPEAFPAQPAGDHADTLQSTGNRLTTPISTEAYGSLLRQVNVFDLSEIELLKSVGEKFLEQWQIDQALLRRLEANWDCAAVTPPIHDQIADPEVAGARNRLLAAAGAANQVLNVFCAALEAIRSDQLQGAGRSLQMLGALCVQPRTSIHALRIVLEDAVALVSQILSEADAQRSQNIINLSEIHLIDDFLERPRYSSLCSLESTDLWEIQTLGKDLQDAFARAQEHFRSVLSERKHTLLLQLDDLCDRYDLQFDNSLGAEGQRVRDLTEHATSPSGWTKASTAVQHFANTVSLNPEFRTIASLVPDALAEPLSSDNIISLAAALVTRNRNSEALSLLTYFQQIFDVEESQCAEFYQMVDVLILATAALEAAHPLPFLWVDAVLQQPWIRSLARSDISQYATRRRLAAAFVVQQYAAQTTPLDLNCFYKLDLQNVMSSDKLPSFTQLLRGIGIRQPVPIVADAPQSKQEVIKTRIDIFFRVDERGDYMRHVAAGDHFFEMEKHHLFPSLRLLGDSVQTCCLRGAWDEARKIAGEEPAKLLRAACREAGIPGESDFYRRRIIGDQEGYIPQLLRTLRDYIDAAKEERGKTKEFVSVAALKREMEFLADQESKFERFWKSVNSSLCREPLTTKNRIELGEDILVHLFNSDGRVIVLCPGFVQALCKFGQYVPTSQDLVEMLSRLQAALPETVVAELEATGCYFHAELVALAYESDLGSASIGEDSSDSVNLARIRQQRIESEEELRSRWTRVHGHGFNQLKKEDFEWSMSRGYYSFISRQLSEIETLITREARGEQDAAVVWLNEQISDLAAVKDIAERADSGDHWRERVFKRCDSLELDLRLIRSEVVTGGTLNFGKDQIGAAMVALRFIVEFKAQDFSELQSCLKALRRTRATGKGNEARSTPKPGIEVQDIAGPWFALQEQKLPARQAKEQWHRLVLAFTQACHLYRDFHKTLLFSGVTHDSWGRYTTGFHKPLSQFLNRPLHLYLCLGDRATLHDLTNLREHVRVSEQAEALNIIFVPSGLDRVAKHWDYDPLQSDYLLIDEVLLAAICAAKDKHDVPLRQALHRSIKDLNMLKLFKSDGYVHQRNNIFVGRGQAIQQLAQQPASVIWGGRRTGKTSLLQALKTRLENSREPYHVAFVYGDPSGHSDPDVWMAQQIATEFRLARPQTVGDLQTSLQRACQQQRLAILIDEADAYIEASRAVHGGAGFPLARALRGLTQMDSHQRFKLVYAGFKQLFYECKMKEVSETSYPFKQFLQPVTKDFRDLDPDEVRELAHIGFVEMLGVEMDQAVPRVIWQKTSGHPAFVQRFCERLLECLSRQRGRDKTLVLTVSDVEEMYNEQPASDPLEEAFIYYVNETLGWNISNLGRAMLLALSVASADLRTDVERRLTRLFSAQEIMDLLTFWCGNEIAVPKQADFRNTLQMLTMTNMLTEVRGIETHYRITYPAYIEFMRRLDQLGKVEIFNSLRDYHLHEKDQIK